jgi:hypothetical protein
MEDFLSFVSAEPALKCDFISLHAKGNWSSAAGYTFIWAARADRLGSWLCENKI